MEKTDVKRWIKKHFNRCARIMGLPHWTFEIEYHLDDSGNWGGRCEARPKYEHAIISLNCPVMEDAEELERIVIHELGHCIHSPLQMVLDVAKPLISEKEFDALIEAWHYGQELTVKNIERMHRGHL